MGMSLVTTDLDENGQPQIKASDKFIKIMSDYFKNMANGPKGGAMQIKNGVSQNGTYADGTMRTASGTRRTASGKKVTRTQSGRKVKHTSSGKLVTIKVDGNSGDMSDELLASEGSRMSTQSKNGGGKDGKSRGRLRTGNAQSPTKLRVKVDEYS